VVPILNEDVGRALEFFVGGVWQNVRDVDPSEWGARVG
jgi:hypothetical protein